MDKFLKPTIQNKMLIAILPLLFIQVVIVGGVTLFFALQEFNSNVNQYIQQRENDILTLSENPDILNYLQNIHYELEDEATLYKNNLEELFTKLINRSGSDESSIYKKIVFIDQSGKEIAKVNTEKDDTTYKNLSQEEFFEKAKDLPPNRIVKEKVSKDMMLFYSPLYLDRDGNGESDFSGVLLMKTVYPLDEFKKATLISSLLTLILLVIGIAIIYSTIKAVKRLIEPIHELVDATKSLSKGNLDVRARIASQDEIGQLADSFNRMAVDLKQNIDELEEYKNELEIKVAQRTNELEKSNIDLSEAYKKLKSTQAQLVHSEKMASLGQLVAGVAHELNNPINFIYGNMPHLKNYIHEIKKVLNKFESAKIAEDDKKEITLIKEDTNWEFLLPDLDLIIKDCQNGAQRAKDIVQDLKNFSRLGEAEFKYANIHEGIESTLNLLANYFKNKIKIEKDFDEFGKIECYPDQLNQVFMNLLSNAAQAMPKEKIESGEATIWISTQKENDKIRITIEDNASGIPETQLKKIFDPFYTTKPVGEGTGLGLSITYGIIEKHGGIIHVESTPGTGTKFIIELPIIQK
jgi:signal transduction histidine kinase